MKYSCSCLDSVTELDFIIFYFYDLFSLKEIPMFARQQMISMNILVKSLSYVLNSQYSVVQREILNAFLKFSIYKLVFTWNSVQVDV